MSKTSREYNIQAMTFKMFATVFTVTANVAGLNDSEKHALLVGVMNLCQDSYASLTVKDGFTDGQRLAKAQETLAAVNAGTYAKGERKAFGMTSTDRENAKKLAAVRDKGELAILKRCGVILTAEQEAILASKKKKK